MRFLVDECVWQITLDYVKQLGHDLVSVEERNLSGAEDEIVLMQAVSENRAFLTRDKHFANSLLYPPANYLGIIVLKIEPSTTDQVHRTLTAALSHFNQDTIQKALVIVDQDKFRERR
jgi:predicted nuclease of predicted toxin-antitoxin system